jgi:hypothetical protein
MGERKECRAKAHAGSLASSILATGSACRVAERRVSDLVVQHDLGRISASGN